MQLRAHFIIPQAAIEPLQSSWPAVSHRAVMNTRQVSALNCACIWLQDGALVENIQEEEAGLVQGEHTPSLFMALPFLKLCFLWPLKHILCSACIVLYLVASCPQQLQSWARHSSGARKSAEGTKEYMKRMTEGQSHICRPALKTHTHHPADSSQSSHRRALNSFQACVGRQRGEGVAVVAWVADPRPCPRPSPPRDWKAAYLV